MYPVEEALRGGSDGTLKLKLSLPYSYGIPDTESRIRETCRAELSSHMYQASGTPSHSSVNMANFSILADELTAKGSEGVPGVVAEVRDRAGR